MHARILTDADLVTFDAFTENAVRAVQAGCLQVRLTGWAAVEDVSWNGKGGFHVASLTDDALTQVVEWLKANDQPLGWTGLRPAVLVKDGLGWRSHALDFGQWDYLRNTAFKSSYGIE